MKKEIKTGRQIDKAGVQYFNDHNFRIIEGIYADCYITSMTIKQDDLKIRPPKVYAQIRHESVGNPINHVNITNIKFEVTNKY